MISLDAIFCVPILLGSSITTEDGRRKSNIISRIARANWVYRDKNNLIITKSVSLSARIKFLKVCVILM